MLDQLSPTQPGRGATMASPRRLPTVWLWTTRVLWVAIFLGMVYLNGAAIVAHVERNASGIGGGAAGLRAEANDQGEWLLTVDDAGPAADAGMQNGDVLLAINGVDVPPDGSYREVNRQLYGNIGDTITLTVRQRDGTVRDVSISLIAESLLTIWRRFRVPLGLTSAYLPTIEAVLLAIYLLTSALIFWRRSDDWLALYLTITLVLITPQMSYSWYYLSLTESYWDRVFPLLIAVAVALTLPNFYLLPNGVFVPRWSSILAVIWVIWSIVPEFFPNAPFSIYRTSGATQLGVWLLWFATGMVAQVYRYRFEASPTEQQQIKWLGFGLTVAVVVNLGWTLTFELFPVLSVVGEPHQWMWWIGRTVYVLGMMVLPISIGIAVFLYRLWDIDSLINHTLVYGALTVMIVAIYAVVVTVFDMIFSSDGQIASQVIAITVNLIIFEPLRDWLKTSVDRLMFGESKEVPEIVTQLGERLGAAAGPDEVLSSIVETLSESLKLPYVAVSLRDGDGFRIATAKGALLPAHYVWPLVYQRQAVGQLLLAPREVGVPLKPKELEVIEQVAYTVSAAVHGVLLDYALQHKQDSQTHRE